MSTESPFRRSYLHFHAAPINTSTPGQESVPCTCVIERASRIESLAELVYTVGLTHGGTPQVAWEFASEEKCEEVRKKVERYLFGNGLDYFDPRTPAHLELADLATEDPQELVFRVTLFAANRMLQHLLVEHHPELAIDVSDDADTQAKYAALYTLSEKNSGLVSTARFADWSENAPVG